MNEREKSEKTKDGKGSLLEDKAGREATSQAEPAKQSQLQGNRSGGWEEDALQVAQLESRS